MNQEEKEDSIRRPAASGTFYPNDKKKLENLLQAFLEGQKKEGIAGLISPHAGYAYSGRIAGKAYSLLRGTQKRTVVIIGPNHTGLGAPVSVYPGGFWETPLGKVKVDEEKAREIGNEFWLEKEAHELEHSIEVQIPFMQYTLKDFKIVPVCMMDQSMETAKELGKILSKALDSEKDLVIASTDFSHYVPEEIAEEYDKKAIRSITNLDQEGLYSLVFSGFSMCGYGPVCALIEYTKQNNGRIHEVEYGTSGETTGDTSQVVGYASLYSEVKK